MCSMYCYEQVDTHNFFFHHEFILILFSFSLPFFKNIYFSSVDFLFDRAIPIAFIAAHLFVLCMDFCFVSSYIF